MEKKTRPSVRKQLVLDNDETFRFDFAGDRSNDAEVGDEEDNRDDVVALQQLKPGSAGVVDVHPPSSWMEVDAMMKECLSFADSFMQIPQRDVARYREQNVVALTSALAAAHHQQSEAQHVKRSGGSRQKRRRDDDDE